MGFSTTHVARNSKKKGGGYTDTEKDVVVSGFYSYHFFPHEQSFLNQFFL